ncbi:hypothetical protein TNCV_5085111 [Trichonephila clavipes]|uniref:Uncharacterized protein n=1 Tax=Trichonephila clavipes TaxID=2585209 RepID=A0A8X6VCA4_TRICX|nr:hypothetical protein TNCV_5085111 [Trichonephila clavipes]
MGLTFLEEPFPVLREFVGGGELICPETHLSRMSQTCSWVRVRRTRWSFHSCDSFLEKEIIHQISTMWLAIVTHLHDVISNCYSVRNSNCSEDFIPISVRAPIRMMGRSVHPSMDHSSIAKSDTSERHVPSNYQEEQKKMEGKEYSFFLHFTCTVAPSLWAR